MKKALIFTVLFAFVLGAMASASETRVYTMGDANNIVKDDANIWLYPSTVNYHPNIFTAEFDGNDFYQAGANFQFSPDNPWVIGAYFSTDEYYHSILNAYGSSTKYVSPYADQRISFIFGRNFNDMPFGIGINYYGNSSKNEDTTTSSNYERSLNRFEIALGLSPMQQKMDVSLAMAFTTWTDKDYYNSTHGVVDLTKPNGNIAFRFLVRYWMDPMNKCVLIPHAGLFYDKQGIDNYAVDGANWVVSRTVTEKEFTFDLGLGMNYEASEDVLVVTDFGFRFGSDKTEFDYANPATDDTENKTTTTTIPYFKVGIDASVLKWLDFRAGVTNEWTNDKYEPTSWQTRKSNYANTDTYFGAGFHWGDLAIDAEINTDFVENGPYFLSGQDDDLTERVSFTYFFD